MTMKRTVEFSAGLGDLNQHAERLLEGLIVERGLTFRRMSGWTGLPDVSHDKLPWAILAEVIFSNGFQSRLYEHPSGALIELAITPTTKNLTLDVAAGSLAARDRVIAEAKALLPERPILSDREEVLVSFWSLAPNGARAIERTISIAPWAAIQKNYTPDTQTELTRLMVGFRPSRAGQLVLWHGLPGTGKTHALRALAWEWRKWCSCHYITDPETFFGSSANYMLDVLLLRSGGPLAGVFDDDDNDDEGQWGPGEPELTERRQRRERWRLLILEDSGELMTPDAKSQTGQGLSRLLNVVDGLIGQGLRVMVLVTTNEVLKKLHPAVARPGRCAARIEFAEFHVSQAQQWLIDRGLPLLNVSANISLAELFAKADPQIIGETKRQEMGFAG